MRLAMADGVREEVNVETAGGLFRG